MTVFLRPGHNKWVRRVRNRTDETGRNLDIMDMEHVRVEVNSYKRDRLTDMGWKTRYVNAEFLGKVWRHVAVVTLTNGECYVGVAQYNYNDQFEGKPYIKRNGYNIAVGKALKRAAINAECDFWVDPEYRGKEYGDTVRAKLAEMNYFNVNSFNNVRELAPA